MAMVGFGDNTFNDLNAQADLTVDGNATIGGNLIVVGDINVNDLVISGDLGISGNLTVEGTTLLKDDIQINGCLVVKNAIGTANIFSADSTLTTIDTQVLALTSSGFLGPLIDSQGSNLRITTFGHTGALEVDSSGNIVLNEGGDLIVDTDTLFVDSSLDRVGINTATPSVALDVIGDVDISNDLTVSNDGLFFGALSVLGSFLVSTADVNLTNVLRVEDGPNRVSINKIGADVDFDVLGDGQFSGDLGVSGDLTIDGNVNNQLVLFSNNTSVDNTVGLTIEQSGTGDAILQLLLTGVQRWVVGADNSDSNKFKIASSADLNTNAHLIIDTSGNVGIGNTSPGQKLEITTSIDNDGIKISTPNTHNAVLTFENQNFASLISLKQDDGSLQFFADINNGARAFKFLNSSATEIFTIEDDGNVGIGITTGVAAAPFQKLHINGNIYLGDNLVPEINGIHAACDIVLSADNNVLIVSDINDTVGNGVADIVFGYGSNTDTNANEDFDYNLIGTLPRVELMRIKSSNDTVVISGDLIVDSIDIQNGNGLSGLSFTIVGESNGAVSATTAMSYGNGSTAHIGIAMPLSGEATHLTCSSSTSSTATFTLFKNNATTGRSVSIAASTFAVVELTTGETFATGNRLHMVMTSGSANNVNASFFGRYN